MVKIRLARAGAKKRPFYHLVAADSRSPRDGRFIERLGFFNPIAVGGETRLRVNSERVDHWVARGAKLTERAAKLVGEARAGGGAEAEPAGGGPSAEAAGDEGTAASDSRDSGADGDAGAGPESGAGTAGETGPEAAAGDSAVSEAPQTATGAS